jgi:CTP:molybdopterin cytidylyltransferase MocA
MIVGVLLAAGASSRMGSPKPLVVTRGGSFLARGIRHLWSACDQVVVVLGSRAVRVRETVEQEFAQLIERGELHMDLQAAHRKGSDGLEVHFVENPQWRSGMYASVRVGLKEAVRLKPEAVLVLPVDHPIVKPRTVGSLAEMIRAALTATRPPDRKDFSYALVPRYRKHRGHPVALSPALAAAVAKDADGENLSDAIRRHARLVGYLDVPDPGVVRNVNRRGD